MNRITEAQIDAIRLAHSDGLLDNAIAERAGVSIATVKRYRKELGLETNCVTTLRGREGERKVRQAALLLGMHVVWRRRDNDKHDLIINGQRVDVKAAMEETGSWRFSLPRLRNSFYGRYVYTKDYQRDCEAVALVCLRLDGGEPSIYLLSSTGLPEEIRIHPGQTYQDALEAWQLLDLAGTTSCELAA